MEKMDEMDDMDQIGEIDKTDNVFDIPAPNKLTALVQKLRDMLPPIIARDPGLHYVRIAIFILGIIFIILLAATTKSFIKMAYDAFIKASPILLWLAFALVVLLVTRHLHYWLIRQEEFVRRAAALASRTNHIDTYNYMFEMTAAEEEDLHASYSWRSMGAEEIEFEERLRKRAEEWNARREILVGEVEMLEKDIWQGGPELKERRRAAFVDSLPYMEDEHPDAGLL
ncbi:uncharacterized protein L3040_006879 [Drepanopeziza brunnea f. sp. 'multigermtubi']|uniref:Uncharacterized protein n=1 Tax=Marssonina brunnea f. sp. multigermtubi (strain MB_m1) TaxID=1072389 RepID=K1WVN4_MARBU|nr:uncharacterized protein MBM_08957 [Drepanopeziza brunnea f. sp. 'multigermtubi' MB_m1]EKD12728.1 hypothetical protein MBM_08957 [Drepanopeziza brunnea f. sp. 'multigermtubi' MB_m1]KAJ5038005.1 hypothetical protein L3040_006879 [Drepanopeziza brunnea f. sp. 'multigermtubi']